jgi:hypothetical protein
MAADYRKFKTPFYEIEIGDSSGQRLVKLPHHILRLVEKVEIVETFVAGEYSTISIDFIEGSREPASPDARLGTSGLYQIPTSGTKPDLDIAGSITNRTGAITDLRFSGNGGITFLTEEERKKGKIDRTPQENVVGDTVTRGYKKEPSRPVFLFQERNQVKVTWGYIEDPASVRSVRGYIMVVQTNFPETGQVRTTIQCQDTRTALDQIATTKGVPFGRRKITGKGNSIVVFEDMKTDALIRDIANKAGMPAIVSENLPADTVDADKQKLWIAGESFHQFMTRLAAIHNAYYTVVPDPKTGKDTLVFIKKTDFENRLVIADTDLTRWKSPGSILKSVEIKADFGGVSGNAQKGIGKNGEKPQITNNTSSQVTQFKGEELVPNGPVGNGNEVFAAKQISEKVANGETTGTVDVNPSSNRKRLDDVSNVNAEASQRNIQLEFTSLGYTKFHPGVIEFGNLGVRYSGKYRLLTVTHTLDSSGYTCRGSATSSAVATGGVKLPDAIKAPETKKTDVQQFKADANSQYRKLVGTEK